MAEKIIRQMAAVDDDGTRYEILEYVLVAITSQLSDSHLAEERSPPRYRLADGRPLKPLSDGVWQLEGQRELRLQHAPVERRS